MKLINKFLLSTIAIIIIGFGSAFVENQHCKCGENCQCATEKTSEKCWCENCQCGKNHAHHGMGNHVNVFLKMMDSMMVAMDAAPLNMVNEGNFLRQMIPHHQGAIAMAKHEIEHGKNSTMIQLAKSILVEQQGEIMEMEAMLQLYPFLKEESSTEYKKQMDNVMQKMMATTPSDIELTHKNIDCSFAMVMLPHHQAAIDMSKTLIQFNPKGEVATYASRIISDQQIEIEIMTAFINQNCK